MLANKDQGISGFLRSSMAKLALPTGARVLDAPTGYGRHAHWLSQIGYAVAGFDLDASRIDVARRMSPPAQMAISWIIGNIEEENNDVFDGNFDLMVCIHYFSENILARSWKALKPGGVLLLETFGGQGENWRSLPRRGWTTCATAGSFDILSLKENSVGPLKENVALKLLARKLSAPALI